jgi:simple sugar transport system permease protein
VSVQETAASGDARPAARSLTSSLLDAILKTKLFWGLALVVAAGALFSPVDRSGASIFLESGNLTDVLRQVSIIGIIAVGMTMIILTGGIDLSVGTVMALGSTLCAMLLTQDDVTSATYVATAACGAATAIVVLAILLPRTRKGSLAPAAAWAIALAAGVAAAVAFRLIPPGGYGVVGTVFAVLCLGVCIGTLSGAIIAYGGLQSFIVTLAMMVTALGTARLMAGQDTSVYPVYTGSNAPASFELLRSLVFGIVPVPGLIFVATVLVAHVVLTRTTLGRSIYAIGGNETAARLSGLPVRRIKITVFAIAAALACFTGVLYASQYRQGKPDAGSGIELDAIAAVVIGGTSLMGGRGSVLGTMAGVLIFGLLSNILQLRNIDSNTQLVLKGAVIVVAVLLQEGNFRALLGSHGPRRRKVSGPPS